MYAILQVIMEDPLRNAAVLLQRFYVSLGHSSIVCVSLRPAYPVCVMGVQLVDNPSTRYNIFYIPITPGIANTLIHSRRRDDEPKP